MSNSFKAKQKAKIEKLKSSLSSLTAAKAPIDAALTALNAVYKCVPAVERACVFVLDPRLQKLFAAQHSAYNWREIPCSGPLNGVAVAVSRRTSELCAPSF